MIETPNKTPKLSSQGDFIAHLTLLLLIISPKLLFGASAYIPELRDPLEDPWQWINMEDLNIGMIHSMDVGPDGTIWVYSGKGLYSLDGSSLSRHGSLVLDDENLRSIGTIKTVNSNLVYMYGQYFFAIWKNGKWKLIEDNMAFAFRLAMAQDSENKLWLSSGNKIALVEDENLQWFVSPVTNPINNFTVDAAGRFWVVESSSGTVSCQVLEKNKLRIDRVWPELLKVPNVNARNLQNLNTQIICTTDGTIWAGNDHDSVLPVSLKPGSDSWETHDLEAAGGSNRIFSILESSDGIIRITASGSILRLDGKQWHVYESPEINLSQSRSILKESNDGYLWFFERFIRLSRIDYNSGKWRTLENLLFQCETDDGHQWFVEKDRRIVRHNPKDNSWLAFDEQDGAIETVTTLFARNDGNLWALGSDQGVAAIAVWDGETWTKRSIPKLGEMISPHSIGETSDNQLFLTGRPAGQGGNDWLFPEIAIFTDDLFAPQQYATYPEKLKKGFGTLSDGRVVFGGYNIQIWDGHSFQRSLELEEGLRYKWANNIESTKDGTIWFSFWSKGIARLKDGKWTHFTESDGLSSNYVSDILVLEDGQLAALTAKGLDRFDGSSWYNLELPGYGGVIGGSYLGQTSDGAIWINIANQGWFNDQVQEKPKHGQFVSLRYLPGSLPPDTTIKLLAEPDRYANSLLVGWAGNDVWSESPRKSLTYSYRTNDGDWSNYKKDLMTFLQDQEPGVLKIEARARDSDGNVDPTPAMIEVSITAPFWKTRWFIATIVVWAVAIAALIYALLLQRVRHISMLSRMRMQFMTNISHELRTPLTLIIGPLEKLVRFEKESGNSRLHSIVNETASMALRNAKRLNQLVEQLLEVRKLETGKYTPRQETFEIVSYTRLAIADFDNVAQTRSQRISFETETQSQWLKFDIDAYRKILDNLVLNAMKYSDQNATTRIRMSTTSGEEEAKRSIELTVEDEGVGIPEEMQSHIFEAFYTGSESKLSNVRSFGVGLALVKELVELNGGTVSVESPINENKSGSRFTVVFPNIESCENQEGETQESASSLTPLPIKQEKDREIVLVVDDQDEIREYLSQELSDEFDILLAKNGAEALEIATQEVPDLILSDVMMPEMDGIQLCREVRNSQPISHVPIILQTALPADDRKRIGIDAGAVDFISKPLSIPNLKGRIRNLLEIRKRFAERLKAQLIKTTDDEDEETADTDREFIERSREIMKEFLGHPNFGTEDFATKMGMSRATCYRKFKAVTNMPLAEFIKRYRMEKAVTLLERGEKAANVALKVGYSESSSFSRAFKSVYNRTPGKYKEQND